MTAEQNTSFVFQKFTAQMLTDIKVSGLRVMIFSCAQSVKCLLDKQGPPPLSLSVNELYFIGSLLMHYTNIFNQWYLILFLPTPFASANTIIHSSFSYLCFFHFLHCMFSTSAFLLIHAIHVFTFPFLCLLYSIPPFIFLFPSVSRRAL